MKSLIIYCSDYKSNTEKVAQIFSDILGSELMNIKNVNNINVEKYSLIGFGSGVYRESMSPKIFKLVETLNLKNKDVYVFSTSGVGMKFYNNKLIKLLLSKGAINKGSFACKGSFVAKDFTDKKIFNFMGKLSQGHPNDKDFKEAEKFIKKVMDSL